MPANAVLNIRMISEELVVDDAAGLRVPHRRHGHARRAGRIGDRVELMQPPHALVGAGHDVAQLRRTTIPGRRAPGRCWSALRMARDASACASAWRDAPTGRPPRSRGDSGRARPETRTRVAADAMAENGVTLEIEPLVVVLDEDVFGGPFAVDELSHSFSPAQHCTSLTLRRARPFSQLRARCLRLQSRVAVLRGMEHRYDRDFVRALVDVVNDDVG